MKRASKKHKFMVGAFVVLTAGAVAVAILMASDKMTLFRDRFIYFVRIASSDGLHVGAPLKLSGVEIGYVSDIGIIEGAGKPTVQATLVVYSPYERLVKNDARVTSDTQGVLGDKFLSLIPGSTNAPMAKPQSFLQAEEKMSLSTAVAQSSTILASVDNTTQKLSTFAETLPDAATMKAITQDVRQSADTLNNLVQGLGASTSMLRALADKQSAQRLDHILANLESATGHLNAVVTRVDQGGGTLGALVNDVSLYDDMKTLMGRANRSKAVRFVIRQMLETPQASTPALGNEAEVAH